MSRIEQALEKAVRMRETKDAVIPRETETSVSCQAAPHKFRIGELAINRSRVDRHVVSITDPFSSAAEQYKRLRARLLRATAKEAHTAIMVTSAEMDEGKSLTAINLAVALAQEIDHTVLLVDADLRNPSIHTYIGMEQGKGLSEYLKDEVVLSDVLVNTGIGKLVFLPAGQPPDNAAELLSSEKMRMLVHEMKSRYDDRYIIFDSSPLLATAEPISLGSFMDGVLLVIREGRTSQTAVGQALSLTKGWNMLGVVLNSVSDSVISSRYSHYYHRYGHKAEREKAEKGGGGPVDVQ